MFGSKSLNIRKILESKDLLFPARKSRPMTVLSLANSNGPMAKRSLAAFRMSVGAAQA